MLVFGAAPPRAGASQSQVAPGGLSFPTEAIGSQSPPQAATFTNVSSAVIALGAALVSIDFAVQTDSCGNAPEAAGGIRSASLGLEGRYSFA
jgi:hypothetical protein